MKSVYKRTYCESCGNPSHCGIAYYNDLQNYDEPPTTIKACDHCRCGHCTKTEDRK